MILETERLVLRPWADDDAEALFKYASDPRVGPKAGWAVHTSVQNSREIIRGVLSEENTCAVIIKGIDGPVGSVGLFRDRAVGQEDNLEVGYWIGVPFWGQGYIPEAVGALLKYGFETMGERKIWCAHFSGNDNSQRVIQKCGFRKEFLRESDVPALGERRIEVFYSMLRPEWEFKYGEKR